MSKTVLVVDDDPLKRKLLRLMLERFDNTVYEAHDGIDALEKLKTLDIDLMTLDIMMPNMDGYEVCTAVRNNPDTADLPVIIVSARADVKSVQRGLDCGANKYLTQPVRPDVLKSAIDEVLETT